MKSKKKIVYVPLAVDFINEAHIKIIDVARKYGQVIVGLLTDKAIAKYKSLPLINYEAREFIVKNLKYVSKVIPDNSYDYIDNLNRLNPYSIACGENLTLHLHQFHKRFFHHCFENHTLNLNEA